MIRYVELGGRTIAYELTQKPVKNLNLRVRSDGVIAVSAPPHVSLRDIDAFVLAQEDMILRALSRIEGAAPLQEFSLSEGGRIPIFGRERCLCIEEGSPAPARLYEARLCLTVTDPHSEEQIRHALRRELTRLSEKSMPVVCREAAKRFFAYDIPEPGLKYRCMVGKWGSCCPSRREVTFNKFLVCTTPECMEYVATHELAHFLVPDHSPAFHRLMDELMPDWRTRKRMLEPYGYLLRYL